MRGDVASRTKPFVWTLPRPGPLGPTTHALAEIARTFRPRDPLKAVGSFTERPEPTLRPPVRGGSSHLFDPVPERSAGSPMRGRVARPRTLDPAPAPYRAGTARADGGETRRAIAGGLGVHPGTLRNRSAEDSRVAPGNRERTTVIAPAEGRAGIGANRSVGGSTTTCPAPGSEESERSTLGQQRPTAARPTSVTSVEV